MIFHKGESSIWGFESRGKYLPVLLQIFHVVQGNEVNFSFSCVTDFPSALFSLIHEVSLYKLCIIINTIAKSLSFSTNLNGGSYPCKRPDQRQTT